MYRRVLKKLLLVWQHLVICFFFTISCYASQDGGGQAIVEPDTAVVGVRGTWVVKYVVETDSIQIGGGIKVSFLKGFGEPQVIKADSNYYLFAMSSRNDANVVIDTIRKRDQAVPWQYEKLGSIVSIKTAGTLYRSDTIYLVYERFFPPRASYSGEKVLVASDVDGNGTYSELKNLPTIDIKPRNPYAIKIISQSQQVVGLPNSSTVVCYDTYGNIAYNFEGLVRFTSTDPLAILPSDYRFTISDSGSRRFPITLNTKGVQKVIVNVRGWTPADRWESESNPIIVFDSLPTQKIYWGDLHSHSKASNDGAVGNNSFDYALRGSALDFYAQTDHCTWFDNGGIIDEEWEELKHNIKKYHVPGQFVTILGYEFSAREPYGHHNVYFDVQDENIDLVPIFRLRNYRNTINLWAVLDSQLLPGVRAMTIPHHTGIIFRDGSSPTVSFTKEYSNDKYRRTIEIFSEHGSSEYYAPSQPLSYENITNYDRRSNNGPFYARDAWAKGNLLGVIASTDDHNSRPGYRGKGLVAVYATALERSSIFDALVHRNSYGTTGERIILEFSINGNIMGSEVFLGENDTPVIHVAVHGTNQIEEVEIMKWDSINGEYDKDGHPMFEIFMNYTVLSDNFDVTISDNNFTGSGLFYVRVKQKSTTSFESRAWSSPIWIHKGVTNVNIPPTVPQEMYLLQNYPNPFNPETRIDYGLPFDDYVELTVYDLLGKKVFTLVDKFQRRGNYTIPLTSNGLSSGIYIYTLKTKHKELSKKMLIIR